MGDLIIREALIKKAFTYEIGEKRTAKVVFLSDVQKAKTVDAVEVVRCRDCKWADPCICVVCEEGNTVVCGKFHMHANKDGFCSYGERKVEYK